MPLDDIVIPNLQAVLIDSAASGPLAGYLGAIRYGEQLQVAQPPELWILNASSTYPEGEGSEREQTDWVVTLRCLFPFANDQKHAEEVLAALIEPIRSTFRLHLKLNAPTKVARARVLGTTWMWTVVDSVVYRTHESRLAVREKFFNQFNP